MQQNTYNSHFTRTKTTIFKAEVKLLITIADCMETIETIWIKLVLIVEKISGFLVGRQKTKYIIDEMLSFTL